MPATILSETIHGIRTQLFQAQAVVTVVRHAVTTRDAGLDETTITHALKVAEKMIDAIADELEQFEREAP